MTAFEQPIQRAGLLALLRSQSDFLPVGEASSSAEAIERCRDRAPDLLVLESLLSHDGAIGTIGAVHQVSPHTHVLAVADRSERRCPVLQSLVKDGECASGGRPCDAGTDCLQLAIAQGALGAIRLSAAPEDLFRACRAVAMGSAWLEAETAARLVARALAADRGEGSDALSARDVEVAALIADGRCNKEIASLLGIGEPTVKKHVGRVLDRLGLRDRVQLALYLVRHPLLLLQREERAAR